LTSVWGGALGATVITGLREVLRDLGLPLWEAVIMGGLNRDRAARHARGIAGAISGVFESASADRR